MQRKVSKAPQSEAKHSKAKQCRAKHRKSKAKQRLAAEYTRHPSMPLFASGQCWGSVKSCLAVESVLRLCVRGCSCSCSCSGCGFVNANGRCLLGLECEGAVQWGEGNSESKCEITATGRRGAELSLPSFSVIVCSSLYVYVFVCECMLMLLCASARMRLLIE